MCDIIAKIPKTEEEITGFGNPRIPGFEGEAARGKGQAEEIAVVHAPGARHIPLAP